MKKSTFLILLAFLLSAETCQKKPKEDKNSKFVSRNFVIILDLSDRLLSHPNQKDQTDQIAKDKALIKKIFELFKSSNISVVSNDEFSIQIAKQQGTPIGISELGELRLNMETVQRNQKRQKIEDFEKNLDAKLDRFYEKATQNRKAHKDYEGADIWQYFNTDLKEVLRPEIKNHVFVLTDGYFDFESPDSKIKGTTSTFLNNLRMDKNKTWQQIETAFDKNDYGILPTSFQNEFDLTVMVLEVNPKYPYQFEFQLLEKMWYKWFESMKIDRSKLKVVQKQGDQKVQEMISKFINLPINAFGVKPTLPKIEKKTGIQSVEKKSGLGKEYQGQQGNIVYRLLIENVVSKSGKIEFQYSLIPAPTKHKNQKAVLNLADSSITFDTLGKGKLEIQNTEVMINVYDFSLKLKQIR